MNIFLEEKLALSKQLPIKEVLYSKDTRQPIMAVIYDREVHFFDERFNELCSPYNSVSRITAFTWSPTENRFVMGHENGLVACFDPNLEDLKTESDAHASEVIKIDFAPNGGLMLTQDKNFNLVFWKGMSPVKMTQKAAPINMILFINFKHEKKDKIKKVVKLGFLGDKMGAIEYFEEKRLSVQELCKINGSIKEMFFYAKSNSIIVITSTYYFIQFKISTEEDIVPDKKLKLSMTNGPEHLTGLWIEPNSFMLNSKEPLLKFWNVETDTNYSLNIYNYLDASAHSMKLKINQVKYNAQTGMLFCLLSNNEFLILKKKLGSEEMNEDAWQFIECPQVDKNNTIVKMNVDTENSYTLIYQNSISILRNSCLKLFIDTTKDLKFLIKNTRQIDYFDSLDQEIKTIESQEFFDDILISDQALIVLTKKREILVSSVLELLNSTNKLSPVLNDQAIFGLKKYNKIEIMDPSAKVHLTKQGYVIISGANKLNFVNYKTSVQSDYCSNDPSDIFQEIVMANSYEKFAVLSNNMFVKVFETSQQSLKILHENIDLKAIIEASVDYCSKDGTANAGDMDELLFGTNRNNADSSANKNEVMTPAISFGNIRKLVIDEEGGKLVLLTNLPKNNLIFHNIKKKTTHYLTIDSNSEIETIAFDKTDKRYFSLMEKLSGGSIKKYVQIYAIDDEQMIFFDKIEVSCNRYLVGTAFPDIYLSYYDTDKKISLELKYPNLFSKILKERDSADILKSFAREFCFNISVKRLNKALIALKKVEKNYDMDAFWKSLFDIALVKRNLKIAELCLAKMKFVRGKQFVEMPDIEQGFNVGTKSDNEKLGNLALCFNNLALAKQIFMEEKNYFKIGQILFMEGEYGNLIKFCQKYEKSLLNYYFYEISKIYKQNRNYSEFFSFIKKSKLSDEFIVRSLSLEDDNEFLKKYLQSENSKRACYEFFRYYQSIGNQDKAREFLEKNKDLKPYLAEFHIKQTQNLEQAKALSTPGNDGLNSQIYISLAAHKENEKDLLASIELLIKGQSYLKAIKMLSIYKDVFDKNENFKNKILDLLFNQVVQPGYHYAAGALANYFVSINLIEKAIKLYLNVGDCKKAYWLAKSYNLVHLLSRIETKFSSAPAVEQKTETRTFERKGSDLGVSSMEKELKQLLDAGRYDQAINFMKTNKASIKLDNDFIAKIKAINDPSRNNLMAAMASVLKVNGMLDEAIDTYLELKNNTKAFKVMMKGNKTAKIIQFANFCREDSIYIQAANYLQTSEMRLNDPTFQSIVLFYCKAKQFKSAIEFMRNFAITCFDDYNFEGCLNLLEKIEKLIERLIEPEKSQYSSFVATDMLFISKYTHLLDKMNQMSFTDGIRMAEDLLATAKSSIFWNAFKLNLQIFKCHLNLNNQEEIREFGDKLEGMDLKSFFRSLSDQERAFYMSVNQDTRLSNFQRSTLPQHNDIEEELD